jgi:methylmalonyl-CoA mutase
VNARVTEMAKFPQTTAQDWRAQVDKELAGVPFEKALVHRTAEGLSTQPLYTERPAAEPVALDPPGARFRVCAKVEPGAPVETIADEIEGGADALWMEPDSARAALARVDLGPTFLVLECGASAPAVALEGFATWLPSGIAFALDGDPLGDVARGILPPSRVADARGALALASRLVETRWPSATVVTVSTLPYHDAGAGAADEIAIGLSTGTAYLESLIEGGLSPVAAARHIVFRVASGREAFEELCKLRALRVVWRKILAAIGAGDTPRTLVHAVSSSRTMAQRDPWVNMLRVTTQVFAAILGGADLVTPAAFDGVLEPGSALGRRVARNTALVLRDESSLGKVHDPAGGAYYFEALTDALAREAWKRFQAIEREGGIAEALASGRLRARLDSAWQGWSDLVARRKAAVLGVSEFANLDEKLPSPARSDSASSSTALPLPAHRDAEAFEGLRLRADACATRPEALLVTLGPLAESRPRVGFAINFFGAGGIRVRETTVDEPATIVCLCGSDERYAAEAVARARSLKAAGCRRILLAGRPGPLEATLREAGVDTFIYAGCDAVALLSGLLDELR